VSGRKRNLVLRLLPFADVILDGSRNPTLKEVEAAPRQLLTGVTHALAAPTSSTSQQVESTAAEVEFNRPFVPLESLVSGWSSSDDDDWNMGGEVLELQSGGISGHNGTIPRHLERPEPLTVGSPPPAVDDPQSYTANHVGVPDHGGQTGLSDDVERADTPSSAGEPGETLVSRWLRQQRLIEELRRELCRYRRALAAARLQNRGRSATNGNVQLGTFDDVSEHVTDDELGPSSPAYFTAKRYNDEKWLK